jgi:hypothetical protein
MFSSEVTQALWDLGVSFFSGGLLEFSYTFITNTISADIYTLPQAAVNTGRMIGYFWLYENNYLTLPKLPKGGLGMNGAR